MLALLSAKQRLEACGLLQISLTDPQIQPFNFTGLPIEIRQMVYSLAFGVEGRTIAVRSFHQECFKDWDQKHMLEDNVSSLRFRETQLWRTPTLRCELVGFNDWCDGGKDCTTALLRVSRLVYEEALPWLYRKVTFDFGIDVFGVVPFLSRLSSLACEQVRSIHMELYTLYPSISTGNAPRMSVRMSLLRANERDWGSACNYIVNHLQLTSFTFDSNMLKLQNPAQAKWVQQITKIHGLTNISACTSPSPHSLQSRVPGNLITIENDGKRRFESWEKRQRREDHLSAVSDYLHKCMRWREETKGQESEDHYEGAKE